MSETPRFDHPDLLDEDWARKAERAARTAARRYRRRLFLRRHQSKLAGLIPVIVVALLVGAYVALDNTPNGGQATVPYTPAPAPSTTGTSMIPYVRVDLNQPFVGTPAAGWADGEAGIVAPQPTAMSGLNTRQVGDAYAMVRRMLISAHLDPAVLEGHDIDRVINQYAADAQTEIRPELKDPRQAYNYATRIADGQHLLPVPPKVTGRMWAEAGRPGELVIHTNYVFAYAFHTDHPDRLLDVMDIVAVHRVDADYYVVLSKAWPKSSQGLWPGNLKGYTYSMACGPIRKGELAPAYLEHRLDDGGEPAKRDWQEYFDPNIPMPEENGCPD